MVTMTGLLAATRSVWVGTHLVMMVMLLCISLWQGLIVSHLHTLGPREHPWWWFIRCCRACVPCRSWSVCPTRSTSTAASTVLIVSCRWSICSASWMMMTWILIHLRQVLGNKFVRWLFSLISRRVFTRIQDAGLTELSFIFWVAIEDVSDVSDCAACWRLLTIIRELCLHQILGALTSALSCWYRFDLNVMHLSSVGRRWVIHLHCSHQHLIIAREATLRYELVCMSASNRSSIDNWILIWARACRRIVPSCIVDLSEKLHKFVRLLCLGLLCRSVVIIIVIIVWLRGLLVIWTLLIYKRDTSVALIR